MIREKFEKFTAGGEAAIPVDDVTIFIKICGFEIDSKYIPNYSTNFRIEGILEMIRHIHSREAEREKLGESFKYISGRQETITVEKLKEIFSGKFNNSDDFNKFIKLLPINGDGIRVDILIKTLLSN